VQCPKCACNTTCEVLPSYSDGKWRVRYECINPNCHLRSWLMVEMGERVIDIALEPSKGMVFSRSKNVKCEICEQLTDILHPHRIEGERDYLMCGACKEAFSEAEGLSRFNANYL
jgi:hypothetical protein